MHRQTNLAVKTVRPDTKGRIALGNLVKGVSSFRVTHDSQNRIILEPYTEIPFQEKWLFENKVALSKVKQGLTDIAAGKIKNLGSFSKYKDDEIE